MKLAKSSSNIRPMKCRFPSTIKLNACLCIIYSFFLAWVAIGFVFADTTDISLPSIEASWKLDLDDGYLMLSLTNRGDSPIKISPHLNVFTSSSDTDAASRFSGYHPEVIAASVLFIGALRDDLPPTYSSGPGPRAMEIAPGQTETIKFSAGKQLSNAAKGSKDSRIYLSYHNRIIDTATMLYTGGIWKLR